MAQALADERLLDVPFARPLYACISVSIFISMYPIFRFSFCLPIKLVYLSHLSSLFIRFYHENFEMFNDRYVFPLSLVDFFSLNL
jgi:hypothetical protein